MRISRELKWIPIYVLAFLFAVEVFVRVLPAAGFIPDNEIKTKRLLLVSGQYDGIITMSVGDILEAQPFVYKPLPKYLAGKVETFIDGLDASSIELVGETESLRPSEEDGALMGKRLFLQARHPGRCQIKVLFRTKQGESILPMKGYHIFVTPSIKTSPPSTKALTE